MGKSPKPRLQDAFERVDIALTRWMARYGVDLLRISLGLVFFWFGALKFFPGMSPAAELATRTISILTFGLVPPVLGLTVLATWETLIGIGLIFKLLPRLTLFLLWVQMLGTITPLLLFPGETFIVFPLAPTLEGQYIFKNLVLISAGLVIGATVRGGRIVSDPHSYGSVKATEEIT
ncbi:MAG: DoxX family membrane protein [Chloroflexi bacterium]|nr:DoxX family membrane protein [Chloroflexota bacterium]